MARIYQTPTMGEAHVKVAIVGRGAADLLVYRTDSWGMAHGEARWFITRNKQDANTWIYFTSLGMAQVAICFVDNHSEAGWVRPSPYKNRFR